MKGIFNKYGLFFELFLMKILKGLIVMYILNKKVNWKIYILSIMNGVYNLYFLLILEKFG